jgi:hypothetical protein
MDNAARVTVDVDGAVARHQRAAGLARHRRHRSGSPSADARNVNRVKGAWNRANLGHWEEL